MGARLCEPARILRHRRLEPQGRRQRYVEVRGPVAFDAEISRWIPLSRRFNRIAWGQVHKDRTAGVIAAGMENGELVLWDPAKIV